MGCGPSKLTSSVIQLQSVGRPQFVSQSAEDYLIADLRKIRHHEIPNCLIEEAHLDDVPSPYNERVLRGLYPGLGRPV